MALFVLGQTLLMHIQVRSRLCPMVTTTELDYLRSGLTVSELNPKHFYLHANTVQKEIGCVFSDLLRIFYIDNNGHQISVNFLGENRYVTHYPAFLPSIG
jgi:CRP/FNR family transcriptional regulator